MVSSLVIIDYFHVKRPWGAFRPLKANPPLVVYADAPLALPVTLEAFKPVSRGVERHKAIRRMEAVQPQHSLPLKPFKGLNSPAFKKGSRAPIAKAYDHAFRSLPDFTLYVKHKNIGENSYPLNPQTLLLPTSRATPTTTEASIIQAYRRDVPKNDF
jgi:hypothetical protein